MNSCYLCNGRSFKKRSGTVRDNAELEILECADCGLVFLSSFAHIKEGFYESSGMHAGEVDRESWIKETARDDERRFNTLCRTIENKSVLDFGCGNSGFLLKARKAASHVEGVEPEEFLKSYFSEQGLTVHTQIENIKGKFDVITMFHVLEHLPDPKALLAKLADKLNDGGLLIIEVPSADDALLTLYKCEPFSHFTYWSCHLYLFNQATLSKLGTEAGFNVNYVKQIQRYPLSNHLHWLAQGKPGGHQTWDFLNSPELNDSYEKQLAGIGACDTIMASFSKGMP